MNGNYMKNHVMLSLSAATINRTVSSELSAVLVSSLFSVFGVVVTKLALPLAFERT